MTQYRSSAAYRRARASEDRFTFACLCAVMFIAGMVGALILAAAPMLEG